MTTGRLRYRSFLAEYKKSFGIKIIRAFIAVIVIVLSAFTFFLMYYQSQGIRRDLAREGRMLASLLAYSSKTGVFAENAELLRDVVQGILNQKEVVSVSVYAYDGRPLLTLRKSSSAPSQRSEKNLEKPIMAKLQEAKSFEMVETSLAFEFMKPVVMEVFSDTEEALYYNQEHRQKAEKVIGYVQVVLDKHVLNERIKSILFTNAFITLIFILSGAVIIFIAVRKVTRPLAKLTEGVRLLGEGEYMGGVPVESEDEIGRLAGAFNTMSENLLKREEEKKALEEQLVQAKKLEAIGTLAKGIAHDFNNILTTVQGAVYILQKKLGSDNPLQQYTEKMRHSLVRAQDLVQSLLIFSRGQVVRPEPVNLNKLVEMIEPALRSCAGDQIKCVITPSHEALMVMADRVQMEQVFMNLASNARDAMPEGGMLIITTEMVSVDGENGYNTILLAPGRYALVSVSDTGTGISERIKERIFEPFFTTKEVGKGTGLGLSIVYGIIEQHKGRIEVVTEEGKGTTFMVYLPLFEEYRMADRGAQETV